MADSELVNISGGTTDTPIGTDLIYGVNAAGTVDKLFDVDGLNATAPELIDGVGTTVDSSDPDFLAVDIAPSDRVDVQTFTANGTWTKPANVSAVSMTFIRMMGPGGGGGGGRVAATGATRWGGGGGGAGCLTERWIRTVLLGATETVVCPAGGAGGAGGVNPTNNGTIGSNAADTTFGSIAIAGGGFAGSPGTATTGIAGSGALIGTQFNVVWPAASGFGGPYGASNPGGIGGAGAGYGTGQPGGKYVVPVGNLNPGGGGGGGGITSGTTTEAGCAGGDGDFSIVAAGTAGADAGGAGGAAGSAGAAGIAGGGGGGGGSKNGAHGGAGGAGGIAGGGGGGGGASSGASSGNGGAGGAGGRGYVEIVTWL